MTTGDATRRDLVRRGLVAGGATLAAASAPALAAAPAALAAPAAASSEEIAVLQTAAGLEDLLVFTYGSALRSLKLDPPVAATLRSVVRQEKEHQARLAAALAARGHGTPAGVRAPSDNQLLEPYARVHSQRDFIHFALDLEATVVAAYHDAQRKLRTPALLELFAQVMGNEGQHLALLRVMAGRPPVPSAFETGNRETR